MEIINVKCFILTNLKIEAHFLKQLFSFPDKSFPYIQTHGIGS